jgi:hypothetical protein
MEQLQSHIWLTASSYMVKYLRISPYSRKPFLIYDLCTILNFLIYEENLIFFFISEGGRGLELPPPRCLAYRFSSCIIISFAAYFCKPRNAFSYAFAEIRSAILLLLLKAFWGFHISYKDLNRHGTAEWCKNVKFTRSGKTVKSKAYRRTMLNKIIWKKN